MKRLYPIRICIGTEPKTELMRYVLQYSILRRTASAVEFTPMSGTWWDTKTAGLSTARTGTGFSTRRWLIPEYFEWAGRAIYLDADQIVLADIEGLWDMPDVQPCEGCAAWMTYQQAPWIPAKTPTPVYNSSVMVIDCEAAKHANWDFQRLVNIITNPKAPVAEYRKFMYPDWMRINPEIISNDWNSLDTTSETTKLLHYTDEPRQPPYFPSGNLASLWREELVEALKAKYIPKEVWDTAVSLWSAPRLDHRKTQGLHPDYHSLWHSIGN